MPCSRPVARIVAAWAVSVAVCLVGHADQAAAAEHEPPRRAALATEPAKACDLGFVPVKPTEGVGTVIGTAWAQCDVEPQTHVMTVSLELRPRGSGWVTMASAPPDPTIPPGRPFRASYQVKTLCQPGLWRVSAEAHGTGPTGLPFSFADYSLPAIIQCSRGK